MGLRGVFAVGCALLTLPVFALLAFTFVPPLVSTIWLGVTYSFAAVSTCGIVNRRGAGAYTPFGVTMNLQETEKPTESIPTLCKGFI